MDPSVQQPAPQQQPAAPAQMPGTAPSDYLVWSIITILLVSLPFGIAALILSLQSREALQRGDVATAASKGKTAKTINIVGLVVTAVVLVLFIGISVFGALASNR